MQFVLVLYLRRRAVYVKLKVVSFLFSYTKINLLEEKMKCSSLTDHKQQKKKPEKQVKCKNRGLFLQNYWCLIHIKDFDVQS